MSHLLGADWIKLSHRWMPRVILLIPPLIIGLIYWGVATTSDRVNLIPPRGWVPALFFMCAFAPFIWPVLGGSWAGSEYGWGTIRMVLSRRPSRSQFVGSALIILLAAVAIGIALVLVLMTLVGGLIGVLTGHSFFDTNALPGNFGVILVKMILTGFFIVGFYVVLAYAFGTIFRSSSVGIGAGIGISVAQLIVSGIFIGLGSTWKSIGERFPYQYANQLATRVADEATTGKFLRAESGPGISESAIGLAIYTAILLVATFLLIQSRDVTS